MPGDSVVDAIVGKMREAATLAELVEEVRRAGARAETFRKRGFVPVEGLLEAYADCAALSDRTGISRPVGIAAEYVRRHGVPTVADEFIREAEETLRAGYGRPLEPAEEDALGETLKRMGYLLSSFGCRMRGISENLERRKRALHEKTAEDPWGFVHDVAEAVRGEIEARTMYIAASGRTVPLILRDGTFRNQFETGTSGGDLDLARRSVLEAAYLGVAAVTPGASRPIYGYLGWKPRSLRYGHYSFEMDARLKGRATFTIGDSLGARSFPARFGAGDGDLVLATQTQMCGQAESAMFERFDDRFDGKPADFRRWVAETIRDRIDDYGYAEFQVHGGGVTMDSVKRIHYDAWECRGEIDALLRDFPQYADLFVPF